MKKIMILAAAIAMAAMANAAAVGWTIMGASNYKSCDYSLFVIGQNGVTSVEQITTLVAAGTSVDTYAFASGTVSAAGVASVGNNVSGKTITYGGSGTETHQAFAVLWNADGTQASHTSVASFEMANDSQSKTFAFGNQGTNLANNAFEVVPEPTSGLLLLLGVAGLALKRKRA
jgi:hypothetical protein